MKTIVVELDPVDYDRLRDEAQRQGKAPEALARDYLRAGLAVQAGADEKRRGELEALDRLRDLTADLPAVDAVRIARESRQELERRGSRW